MDVAPSKAPAQPRAHAPAHGVPRPLPGQAGRRSRLQVRSPMDLVHREEVEAQVDLIVAERGGASGSLSKARERVAYLEGALEASVKLERAAQSYADKLEERALQAREDYHRELGQLRTLLDQRERELRTLALEMGKVQGRLEAAEQKLIESGMERSRIEERARTDATQSLAALTKATADPQRPSPVLERKDLVTVFYVAVGLAGVALLTWMLK